MLPVSAADVRNARFRVALRGYFEDEVDAFLGRVADALADRESGRRATTSAVDVQRMTFKVALRGYAEQEVDEFLDRVVATLKSAPDVAEGEDVNRSDSLDESTEVPESPPELPRIDSVSSAGELVEQAKK